MTVSGRAGACPALQAHPRAAASFAARTAFPGLLLLLPMLAILFSQDRGDSASGTTPGLPSCLGFPVNLRLVAQPPTALLPQRKQGTLIPTVGRQDLDTRPPQGPVTVPLCTQLPLLKIRGLPQMVSEGASSSEVSKGSNGRAAVCHADNSAGVGGGEGRGDGEEAVSRTRKEAWPTSPGGNESGPKTKEEQPELGRRPRAIM